MKELRAIIYITGLPGIDKPEKLKIVKGTRNGIIKHIKKLQREGYGGRVRTKTKSVNCSDGKKRNAVEAYSDVDFSHTAIML